jgi:voltage-gated potassium channel Kch
MMGHIVVCGLGRFGLTIVEALRSARRGVTVITDARTNQDRIDRATAAGATIVAGDFRCAGARHAANVHGAAAVLLTTSNDVDNLETALEVRDEVPAVPVVMRHSEPRLNR